MKLKCLLAWAAGSLLVAVAGCNQSPKSGTSPARVATAPIESGSAPRSDDGVSSVADATSESAIEPAADPEAVNDAEVILKTALARAADSDRSVFVHLGAPW